MAKKKTAKHRSDWHSAAESLLKVKLHKRKDTTVESEVKIGTGAPRTDFVIVVKNGRKKFEESIFKIFRHINVIEYKRPRDSLNEWVIRKVVGYTNLLMANRKVDQVTMTIIRSKKNSRFFKKWKEKIVSTETSGIYRVNYGPPDIPFQIVITSELEGKEYAAFRALTDKASKADIEQVIKDIQQEKDSEVKALYDDYFDVVVDKNPSVFNEMWRDEQMSEALKEIMKDEFEKREQETTVKYLRDIMKNLKLSLDQAMDALSIPQPQRQMYAALV